MNELNNKGKIYFIVLGVWLIWATYITIMSLHSTLYNYIISISSLGFGCFVIIQSYRKFVSSEGSDK